MAVIGEVVLRPRVCRSQGCQTVFWICSHCDRGRCYCRAACRTEARRRQRRAANGRHQRSLEGRLDHRDRQRAYRRRRVTDQGSLSVISTAPFGCGETITPPVVVPLPCELSGGLENGPTLWLRCAICVRPGRFVDPFPQIPRRSCTCMISPETRVQIRRYFYAEHWKIGTIATALDVHPDTVRRAIEVERFQHAEPLRPSIVVPYLPLLRQLLEQRPRVPPTPLPQLIP